jgi:hypothetical protein
LEDNVRTIQLVHWKAEEVPERIERLQKAGFAAEHLDFTPGQPKRKKPKPPDAYLIDLSRLPSHGKTVAYALRQSKTTRGIPLVFVDGDSTKVAALRELFPDATYTTWPRIKTSLVRAMARPAKNPVVPRSDSGAYSSTALAKKLGIKSGSVVALLNAPAGFDSDLSPLPENVSFRKNARGKWDLAVWFVDSLRTLDRQIDSLVEGMGAGGLWIAWPKKASGVATDLSEGVVRKLALAAGLVDYKVCAIDETWSGLKFAKQKSK